MPQTAEHPLHRPDVSLLIPAHNEAANIPLLLEKINRCFTVNDLRGEAVIIDDGSTDDTGTILDAAKQDYPWLHVVHQRGKHGITKALDRGFRIVKGDTVIFLPADLESDPEEDVPKLLAKLAEGYDVVAGWRQGRRDGKVPASRVYNAVSRLLFGVQAHDMNWIKAFRREVVENLPPLRSDWHRFLLMIAASQGYRIGEVKTNYYPRRAGRSKFGVARIPTSFLDVLVVKFLLTFSQKPMLFFGSLGMISILGGVGIDLYLLYLWIDRGKQQRPLFYFAGVVILAGLLLFLVGFLAELVVNQATRIEAIERQLRQREKP
ncbi:MAG: glycosyltransferase family 2 protein [Chloroflexi bacterium]|nr:glycosyltransferase family 2 protein [Chloroflexota bacterium]